MPKRIYLVGCGKSKRSETSPARDLYTGHLFRKSYQLASQVAARNDGVVYILSAMHGAINPDDPIAPYDLALSDLTESLRCAWGRNVAEFFDTVYDLSQLRFTILAGRPYVEAVRAGVVERLGYSIPVHDPMKGMQIGRRLQFLNHELTSAL